MYWFQRWFEKIVETLRFESGATQEAIKSQVDAIRIDRESAEDEQKNAADIIAGAIESASESQSEYEQPQRAKEYRIQVVLAAFTIIAALGAIFAAIGTWKSLSATKESADAAKKAAEIAACALRESQQQFKETSASNQEQFRTEERAWVVVYEIVADTDFPTFPPTILIHYRNTGKTPALDGRIRLWQVSRAESIPANGDPLWTKDSTTFILAPQGVHTAQVTLIDSKSTTELDGRKRAFIYGTIWYSDTSRHRHWTEFCTEIRWNTQNGLLNDCQKHYRTDD